MTDRPPSSELLPSDEDESDVLDPGSQSLSDALRISFAILKVIMFVLVGYYVLLGGVFRVQQNESAIILRFGRVVDADTDPIRGPGWHWGFPFPIDDVVKLKVKEEQTLKISTTNYRMMDREILLKGAPDTVRPTLKPVYDGYTLTGDGYIIHSKWDVGWKIEDPYLFVTAVYNDPFLGKSYVPTIDRILDNELCKSVISGTSGYRVMDILTGSLRDEVTSKIRSRFTKQIQMMSIGVAITSLNLSRTGFEAPKQVKTAFDQVAKISSERQQKIDQAKAGAKGNLSLACGSEKLAEKLFAAVRAKHTARKRGSEEFARASSKLSTVLRNHEEGMVAQMISSARAAGSRIVDSARADASKINMLAPRFNQDPEIFRERLSQEVAREVFSNRSVETFIFFGDVPEIDLKLNPDARGAERVQEELQAAERQRGQ
jgi:regulator of protease activity HflC (stomatin/prohibitin superfamily)